MSLSSETNTANYTGNGTTDTYSYPFKIFSQSDLLVIEKLISTGAETPLALSTDYTVTGVGSPSGGSIVLVAGNLPSTKKLFIRRKMTLTQVTDIRNLGAFYPSIHEDVFDKLVMMIQELNFLCGQAIKLPETITSGFDTTLPVDITTPERTIVTTPGGDGFELGPTVDEIANAQAYALAAQAAQGFAEAAQAAAELAQAEAEAAAQATVGLVFGSEGTPKIVVAGDGIVGADFIDTAALNQTIFVEGVNAGENDITANPQIAAGTVVGQNLRIVGANNTNYIKLETGNGLLLNGFWLSNNDSILSLFWTGSVWREQWRNF